MLEPQSSPAGVPSVALEPRPRLWPGVIIVVLMWLTAVVPGWIAPVTMLHFMCWFLSPFVALIALAGWWLYASRVPRFDRWFVLVAFFVIALVTWLLRDPSFVSIFLVPLAMPIALTAWVVWLGITPWLHWPARRTGLIVAIALAWGAFLFLRYDGAWGGISADLHYRWGPTDEERYLWDLASGKITSAKDSETVVKPLELQPGDWPAFRGPRRDGRLPGIRIATDWNQHPPRKLWRHRVGPGWGSFAVVGNRAFTQEQRGDDEVVACYDGSTGAEMWSHKDQARFTEAMAGPGPRATPTFHEGKIYAQGATGKLNCLDAATGQLIWTRDVSADSGANVPQWGFASSPLVVHGIVTVFAGGEAGKSVLGYDAGTGTPVWSAGEGQFSYCSLQPVRLGDSEQLLITSDRGLTAYEPKSGKVLWEHAWPLEGGMSRVVQPAQIGDADFLLGTSFGFGARRIHVENDGTNWNTREVWTTKAIKPYFNDLVIHKGHLYGFDNNFLTCIELEAGKKKWRERGYGNGQLLLLPDQDLLLILSEQGQAALVAASPDACTELGHFEAIEGKTWNHPVLAHNKLFVRNGAEAACYELKSE